MRDAGRVAVIGGGWAGLAAAIEATRLGYSVTLYEMAGQLGGRAREVKAGEISLDNGQHILIGAYAETLRLMREVGVDTTRAFVRTPLRITYPQGAGLHLGAGPAALAFALAVLRYRGWSWRERLALLRVAAGWTLTGFTCETSQTVADLAASLPPVVRAELIDPLCVAALNTPAHEASASVFLRVLRDALLSGPGSADLLLPRVSLTEVLAAPAMAWLLNTGAQLRLSTRVERLESSGTNWQVDGVRFDHVLLATTAVEAARLVASIAPAWSTQAGALRYEPIVTVYLRSAGTVLAAPMLALQSDEQSPAQFVFDRGQLGGPEGLLSFVISGAQPWVDRGLDVTLDATLRQARHALGGALRGPLQVVKTLTERRATFRCTPNLQRPAMQVQPSLLAAGDFVAGPYPATLEGAVRSGVAAARQITAGRTAPPTARR